MLKSKKADELLNSFEDKPIAKIEPKPLEDANNAIAKLTEQVSSLSEFIGLQAQANSLQMREQSNNTQEILLANQAKQINLEAVIHRDEKNLMNRVSITVKRSN